MRHPTPLQIRNAIFEVTTEKAKERTQEGFWAWFSPSEIDEIVAEGIRRANAKHKEETE